MRGVDVGGEAGLVVLATREDGVGEDRKEKVELDEVNGRKESALCPEVSRPGVAVMTLGEGGVLSTVKMAGLVSLEILPAGEKAPVEELTLALRVGVPFLDGTPLPVLKERS